MKCKLDDVLLLERLKKSDEKAFEIIYRHYWESLFNKTYQRLKNEQDAKELIQDLFTELWQKRDLIHIHTSLAAYLHTALRYKIFNYYKAEFVKEKFTNAVKQDNFVASNVVEEAVNYTELNQALQHALTLLPKQPRRVFELKHNLGLTYAEIAISLEISVSTVEKHMIKAMKVTRRQLKRFL